LVAFLDFALIESKELEDKYRYGIPSLLVEDNSFTLKLSDEKSFC
jgi:hypothetical protein